MKLYQHTIAAIGFLLAVITADTATAVLKIEVTEGTEAGVPIMVLPFAGDTTDSNKRSYQQIITNDLAYSGLFSIVPATAGIQIEDDNVDYPSLLAEGIEKLVTGEVTVEGNTTQVTFKLYDIVQRKRILGSVISNVEDPIRSAHYISDRIYSSLTNVPGIFNTRFAFVGSQRLSWRKHQFVLYVSDIDGYNTIPIFTSDEQLMSPTWSPDAKQIAYVSYENGQPEIFIQTLATAQRKTLTAFTGNATSPKWSPDGCCIAYVRSMRGDPDVYVMNLDNKQIMRVTGNSSIDTEPAWTPDGQLVFTSDRSGSPQLYQTSVTNPQPKRLTFTGQYNSDADVSVDGKQLTFIRQIDTQFSIIRMDRATGDEHLLLAIKDAERPRFAANSHLISHLAHDAVALLTTDGQLGKPISIPVKNIRGIAWSPLLH